MVQSVLLGKSTEKIEVPTESDVLRLAVSNWRKITIIHCKGELDIYTSPWLLKLAQEKLASNYTRFIIDLSHVEYLDTECLKVLMMILNQVITVNGNIRIVIPKELMHIHKLFQITKMKQLLPHNETIDEAILSF